MIRGIFCDVDELQKPRPHPNGIWANAARPLFFRNGNNFYNEAKCFRKEGNYKMKEAVWMIVKTDERINVEQEDPAHGIFKSMYTGKVFTSYYAAYVELCLMVQTAMVDNWHSDGVGCFMSGGNAHITFSNGKRLIYEIKECELSMPDL